MTAELKAAYISVPNQTGEVAKYRGLGWRHAVALLAFFGMFITYMLRVNFNVAIVAMVEGEYVWSEKEQGTILSAFYYGYFITQIPGGFLAGTLIGPKWLFGVGLLVTSVLTLLTPLATQCGSGILIALRFIEGLSEGVLFPSLFAMLGRWTPPLERTKLPAFIMSGYYIGTVTTYAISGVLAASDWGWPSIFYVSGLCGCLWFVFWVIFSSDSPDSHKWISSQECQYIVQSIKLENSAQQRKFGFCDIPWLSIVKSVPVYAMSLSAFCDAWAFYTSLIYLPIYLRNILGYDIEQNGLISALPYLLGFGTQVISSWCADFIRSRYWLKTVNVRKLFDIAAHAINAGCLLCVTLVGCDRSAALMFLTVGTASLSFSASGFSVNHLDLAPIYAGVLMGITNCIGNMSGFIVPTFVGHMIHGNQTVARWSKVFYVAIGMDLFACVFYGIFASGTVQKWAKDKEEQEESV